MEDGVQKLYQDSAANVRASFGDDAQASRDFYASLISFVKHVAPCDPGGATKLLDVGCGSGWSTYHFANEGYDSSGIDLNPAAFEPPQRAACTLSYGSATDIPRPSSSFDVVVCYQCLEHVPDPAKALNEMARVCRPGGTVAVVGPNLLSPVTGIAYIAKPSSWANLSLLRRSGMARHPYGNTIPEVLAFSVFRSSQLLLSLFTPGPRFQMRTQDDAPPFHADNDACYLCNPTSIIRFFRSHGWEIICSGRPGRPKLSYLFAGGTWVAAKKPA